VGNLVDIVPETADRLSGRPGHGPRPWTAQDMFKEILAQQRCQRILEVEVDSDIAEDGGSLPDSYCNEQGHQGVHTQTGRSIPAEPVEKGAHDQTDQLGKQSEKQPLEYPQQQEDPGAKAS